MTETRSLVLPVAEVVEETSQACSVVFDAELDYRPGQFLTVRIPDGDGGSVARCYSLSSSPHTGQRPQVTVKRDGYGSNWICDNVTSGSELEVLPPSGVFTPSSLTSDLLLFAAGSGITPVLSIVRSVLAGGTGTIRLVYANRDEHSVIFSGVLRELAEAHPGRLVVTHWLESVQGLPSAEQLTALAAPHTEREVFICGPRPFMSAATTAMKSLGKPRSAVHTEKFVSLGGNPFDTGTPKREDEPGQDSPSSTLEVSLDGSRHELAWPRGNKLLDLLLDNGIDAPYSCREGQCSACACRITSGEVKMLHNDVLDSEDIADGIVLACQSLPLTDEVSISYE
ncbi:3-ketosteroid-9-alpha-hydroxylase [Prauserella marina]|uniref:3-ketosteroid 9alpha-monooxygenase subunit B n=1 Tax=Prauserella marina TaxID=530584 RepID=A0A222VND7_9PSEU|nr:ferredoxin--NADP reductase [Prauserella marina]ASR35428.1 3-ketosteroid-9-alpha-hydroxylase [Prauserella marina]PWV84764.1 3-ketosteroid 9alpha-monooxygenase subunit B [Prauserella marina]SDC13770.1 3-ketosteroid 9alpha-monooxygenase subunit B [Prauserella marina]